MITHGFQVAAVLLSLSFSLSFAFAEDAGKLFDDLYGSRVKAVTASRDKADDVALAGEILESARTLAESPAVQAVFADKAYGLAANVPEGMDIAVEAARLVGTADPKRAGENRERVMRVLRTGLNRGTAEERKKAGQRLIHEAVAAADVLAEAEPVEAAGLYRQALTVALQLKDPDAASIRAALEGVTARATTATKISQLQERLLANANDKATAKTLAELLVMEMDAPSAAVSPASLSGDAALMANVAAAGKPSLDWSKEEAHALAQWYHDFAGRSSPVMKPKLLRKAATAYERFLAMHADNDAPRLKATIVLKEIEKDLGGSASSIASALPTRPGPAPVPQPTPDKPAANEDDTKTPANFVLPMKLDSFVITHDIQFDSTRGIYTLDGQTKVKDGHHSRRIYIDVGPGVQIQGGKIHLSTRGHLRIKGTPQKPVVFRDVEIIQDLSGSFTAEHAVFENVTFRKGGVWWANYSSKWTFTGCILHKCRFPKLTNVDYAFKFRNTSFTYMTFPETEGPFTHEWRTIENCNFIGCTVPPTIGWCTKNANFYGCEFPAGVKYKGKDVTSEIYLFKTKGAAPQAVWLSEPDAGKVTVKPALKPFDVQKFSAKPAIPELIGDRTVAGVLFE